MVETSKSESVSKGRGIVRLIRESLNMYNPSTKRVRLTGNQEGTKKEVTVSSGKYRVRTFYDANTSDSPSEVDAKMFAAVHRFVEERPRGDSDSLDFE